MKRELAHNCSYIFRLQSDAMWLDPRLLLRIHFLLAFSFLNELLMFCFNHFDLLWTHSTAYISLPQIHTTSSCCKILIARLKLPVKLQKSIEWRFEIPRIHQAKATCERTLRVLVADTVIVVVRLAFRTLNPSLFLIHFITTASLFNLAFDLVYSI